MVRWMTVFGAMVLINSAGLPLVCGDEPATVQPPAKDPVLVNDVDAKPATGAQTTPRKKVVVIKDETSSDQSDVVDLTIGVRDTNGRLELVYTGDSGFVDLDAPAEPQSKYWIGVGCEPATDALKSQLGLGEKPAILITMVADDSPAKAAGIQLHDVITTAKLGDETKPLESVADLTALVMKAEQKQSLVLTVMRQSKSQEITVTPAERPQPNNQADVRFFDAGFDVDGVISIVNHPQPEAANLKRVRILLKELQAAVGEQPPSNDILVTGPVVAGNQNSCSACHVGEAFLKHPKIGLAAPHAPWVNRVGTKAPELPENVTVTITKKGKEPIRIQYQEGEGKVWGATENELATLPQAGRDAVQNATRWLQQQTHPTHVDMWGPPHVGFSGNWPVPYVFTNKGETTNPAVGGPGPGELPARIRKTVTAPATPAPPQDAAARLQALEKRLELVQKQQQELITRQQEALKKELQAVREALEKAEKK